MKNIKRILAVLMVMALVLPTAIFTSFADGATADWTLFGTKYLQSGGTLVTQSQFLNRNYTLVTNADNSMTVTVPNGSRYGSSSTRGSVAFLTSENKTGLDNLEVTLKPGNRFTFAQDASFMSDTLAVMWTDKHPISADDLAAARENGNDSIPFDLSFESAQKNGLRGLVTQPQDVTEIISSHEEQDPTTGEMITVIDESVNHHYSGARGVLVTVTCGDNNFTEALVATKVSIFLFNGEWKDHDGMYGYRWTFEPYNITSQTSNGLDNNPIYSFDEYIDCTEGITFKFAPDATLGYKVFVNGKDFSDGNQVAFFPNNTGGLSDAIIAEGGSVWTNSMTYARDDINFKTVFSDLVDPTTGELDLGEGYLSVGSNGKAAATNTYSFSVISVNGTPAAEWAGETNVHTHNYSTIVDIAATCTTRQSRIRKCVDCGAIVTNQPTTYCAYNPINDFMSYLNSIVKYDTVGNPEYDPTYYWTLRNAKQNEWISTHILGALGHDIQNVRTEPTCTTEGSTYKQCTRCDYAESGYEIPARGHVWGDQVETENGLVRECTVCHTTDTVALPGDEALVSDYWTVASRNELSLIVTPVQETDPVTGEPVFDGEGQPVYETDGEGQVVYENMYDANGDDDDEVYFEAGADGELIVQDSTARHGKLSKLPVTRAFTNFSSKLDGFTATVTNTPIVIDENTTIRNYGLSFALTNRPEHYDENDEFYYAEQTEGVENARYGFFSGDIDERLGAEDSIIVNLLDYMLVNNVVTGTPDDGVYDVAIVIPVLDGVFRGMTSHAIQVSMDDAITVSFADTEEELVPGTTSPVFKIMINDETLYISSEAGEHNTTDSYYFGVASYGLNLADFYNNQPTGLATAASTSFVINDVCGKAPANFIGSEFDSAPISCAEHTWGAWEMTTAPDPINYPGTANDATGTMTRTCSVCGATETKAVPYFENDGYKLVINNASEVNYIRVAEGTYTTAADIKNNVSASIAASVVAANTDANGVFKYEFEAGTYSLWIRYTDNSTYILSGITNTDMMPEVEEVYGLYATIGKLYGVNVMRIAKGTWTTSAEVKSHVMITKTANNLNAAHEYQAKLDEAGDYTVWISFTDDRDPVFLYFTSEITTPEYTQEGRWLKVENLEDVTNMRMATGTYNTSAQIKAAADVATFSPKKALKDTDEYLFKFMKQGNYTIIVQYNNGYVDVKHVTITDIEPTYELTGNSITFGGLAEHDLGIKLDIIRYVQGTYTSRDKLKAAPGAAYIKAAAIGGADEYTFSNLSGPYSFIVQYIDGSIHLYNFTFNG